MVFPLNLKSVQLKPSEQKEMTSDTSKALAQKGGSELDRTLSAVLDGYRLVIAPEEEEDEQDYDFD